jgi:hypothetical protein
MYLHPAQQLKEKNKALRKKSVFKLESFENRNLRPPTTLLLQYCFRYCFLQNSFHPENTLDIIHMMLVS